MTTSEPAVYDHDIPEPPDIVALEEEMGCKALPFCQSFTHGPCGCEYCEHFVKAHDQEV